MTQEKIIDRAKKIKAMADSAAKIGNEAEAQAFATKLQEMCAQHSINMSDLEWAEEVVEATRVYWCGNKVKLIPTWVLLLSRTVANANHCMIVRAGQNGIWFIGTSEAAQACASTMEYLFPAACKIAQAAYDKAYNALYLKGLDTSPVKGYKSGFLFGFITRLKERFEEQAARLREQYASNSTGLMRLSQSLRLAEVYIEKWQGLKTRPGRQLREVNDRGYRDGRAEANRMNVGGPQVGAGRNTQHAALTGGM